MSGFGGTKNVWKKLSVSLQFIGDGRMDIMKMKVFSVRHAFIGGNNNYSATTEMAVCVELFYFICLCI